MVDWDCIFSFVFVFDEMWLWCNLMFINYVQQQLGVQIIVVFKGFLMWFIFLLLCEYGIIGVIVSSLNEVILVKEEMQGEVYVYVLVYLDEDFFWILEFVDYLVFNLFVQWECFRLQVQVVCVGGCELYVGICINFEYVEVEIDFYNFVGLFLCFGVICCEFCEDLLDGIDGLYFYILCEKDFDMLECMLEVVECNFGEFLLCMNWVNFGGGYLMICEGYDILCLIWVVKVFCEKYGVYVILEFGSVFGWQIGWLVSSVFDVVYNVKDVVLFDVFVLVYMFDVLEMFYCFCIFGVGDLLFDDYCEVQDIGSGYFYIIGGIICFVGDVVGEYVFLYELKVGSWVVFDDMIYYIMVKMIFFNGVKYFDIGIFYVDGSYECVKMFGYEEFKVKLS